MKVTVFTPFSLGIGAAAGVLVGTGLWLVGAPWILVILNGLVSGATVLAVPSLIRVERSRTRGFRNGSRQGIWTVGYLVVMAPAIFVRHAINDLDSVAVFALGMLLLLTGFAGLAYGFLMATLEQRDPGDRGGAAPAPTAGGPATAAE